MRRAFAALLFAGLAACSRAPSPIDPALETFVSDDAVLLAGIRLEPLRNTPLFERLAAAGGPLAPRAGFDPRKDARELLYASDGARAVVAARGTFRAEAVPVSLPRSEYRGTVIYGGPEAAFAVLDRSTAVAGTPEAVRAALDRRGQRPVKTNLLARARAIPAEYQAWVVSSGPPAVPGGAGGFDRLLRAVAGVTAFADLRSGLRGEASGACRDEKNARALAEALRGLLALSRLAAPREDPAVFNRVVESVRIEQQRETVRVMAEVPAADAVRLLDLLKPF